MPNESTHMTIPVSRGVARSSILGPALWYILYDGLLKFTRLRKLGSRMLEGILGRKNDK